MIHQRLANFEFSQALHCIAQQAIAIMVTDQQHVSQGQQILPAHALQFLAVNRQLCLRLQSGWSSHPCTPSHAQLHVVGSV